MSILTNYPLPEIRNELKKIKETTSKIEEIIEAHENAVRPNKSDSGRWFACPSCGTAVSHYNPVDLFLNNSVKYCDTCGRKLDLSVIRDRLKFLEVFEEKVSKHWKDEQEKTVEEFAKSLLCETDEQKVEFKVWDRFGGLNLFVSLPEPYATKTPIKRWFFKGWYDLEHYEKIKNRIVLNYKTLYDYGGLYVDIYAYHTREEAEKDLAERSEQ